MCSKTGVKTHQENLDINRFLKKNQSTPRPSEHPPVMGGNFVVDAAAEHWSNPVSKHQIQPEYGDEQADAGRDCRTRLARPNSQARTRTGKHYFSLFR